MPRRCGDEERKGSRADASNAALLDFTDGAVAAVHYVKAGAVSSATVGETKTCCCSRAINGTELIRSAGQGSNCSSSNNHFVHGSTSKIEICTVRGNP